MDGEQRRGRQRAARAEGADGWVVLGRHLGLPSTVLGRLLFQQLPWTGVMVLIYGYFREPFSYATALGGQVLTGLCFIK